MGVSIFFSVIQVILYLNIIIMEQTKFFIEAIAVIDIDPTFKPFFREQQKWLTSIQLSSQIPRDKQNCKYFAIFPGVYMILGFCQKNKDPIYEIDFNSKPTHDWDVVKSSEAIYNSIGAYLCYKTQPNLLSGPICDVDLLGIQRKSRYGESKQVLNIPHSYKLISHQLAFGYLVFRKIKGRIQQNFRPVLLEKYVTLKGSRINLSQLPLFCFPEGIKIVKQIRGFLNFNFVLTLQTGERIYATSLIFKQPLSQQKKQLLEIDPHQQFFYEKALCILSNKCYTDQFGQILQHFYRLSMSKSEIPFWKVIQTFTNELTWPQYTQIGEVGLCYSYSGLKIHFSTNQRYPFISQRALYTIFKFLRIQNIISVFQSLLLERKVIFVSQSKTILGYAAQAFLGLLFPFKWQQVLIPILPIELKQFLTAPVPLIAGISPILVDESIQADSVIVFLDKNEILNDEDNPPLPEKLFKQLMKRLEKYEIYDPNEVTEFLQNPESTYLFKMQQVQDPHFHGYLIRDIFLEFLLTLMKNYKKFVNKPKVSKQHPQTSSFNLNDSMLLANAFKVQDFLSDLGMTKIGSFGYKFTQSSIFTSFIERKLQNPTDQQIIFFDECIERKKNKKQASFISSVKNKQYRDIRNPEISYDEIGPFFYQNFPSILKYSLLKEQQIQIQIKNVEQQQNKLIQLLEEEYYINSDLFESIDCENEIEKKMLSLLLNKNKIKLEQFKQEKKLSFLQSFFSIYSKQSDQISSILKDWPGLSCQQQFVSINKMEYLKADNKSMENAIIGVYEGQNCQILLKGEFRIIFLNGEKSLNKLGPKTIAISIPSFQIKSLVNSIIHKQAGFLIDFSIKESSKSLRTSSLKKIMEQIWNIETIIRFKSWIQCEKQFGTAVTND